MPNTEMIHKVVLILVTYLSIYKETVTFLFVKFGDYLLIIPIFVKANHINFRENI